MIELKFYRDDEYVYINNPDGTTKRVAVEDFESAISGEGGGSDDGFKVRGVSYTTQSYTLYYRDTYKDCSYNNLLDDDTYNNVVTLKGDGGRTFYLARITKTGETREAIFIGLNTNNSFTTMLFTATSDDAPLRLLD